MTTLGPRRRDRRGAAAPTRHGQLRTSHPVAGVLRLLGIALAVVLVAAVSVGGVAVWQVTSSIKSGVKLTDASGKTLQAPPEIGAIDGGVNLLLAGTDTRTGQGGQFANRADQAASSGAGNNDVTMLLHISEDHTNATVISFPRDLMIPVPACPKPNGGTVGATSVAMFNSTLSRGGINCTVLTVQKMTGLKIPFAATISFDGVIGMSDAVGGVTVCLADPIKDPYVGLDLPAGSATLQGNDALAFVRSRHGVGDGSDLGRISNQQVFLSALSRKLTSGGVLGNPVQLYSIAKTAANNMELTDGLSNPSTMVQIALALKDIGLGNITFLQYPTASDPANANRVVPIASSAAVLNAALVADKPIQLSGQIGRAAELDPNATADPVAPAAPSPTPTKGGKTPTPSPTPSASTPAQAPVVLPTTITGQTAAQQTCSKSSR